MVAVAWIRAGPLPAKNYGPDLLVTGNRTGVQARRSKPGCRFDFNTVAGIMKGCQ